MTSVLPNPCAALPAAREAVRLLDMLLGDANPVPAGNGFAFAASLSAPDFDRLSLWLVRPEPPAPPTFDPIAAAQRAAARLLKAVMLRVDTIRPLPSGAVILTFACPDTLHDELMVWGAAVEDLEILAEDDEDGADAERTDDPLASEWPGPPGAASWCGLGLATGGIVSDLSTYNRLDGLTA